MAVTTGSRHAAEAQDAALLQRTLDSARVALRAPGAQAVIRRDGVVLWSGVSGTADGHTPLTSAHMIRVGSVTKLFTAAVVLQLVSEGALRLDDTLALWYPQFRNARQVTVRQMLSHRSGIPDVLARMSSVMRATIFGGHSFALNDLVDWLSRADPRFPPGSRFGYSNGNYVTLGAIIERVSNSTSAQLVRARILTPLRLERTAFLPDEEGRVPAPGIARGVDRDHIPLPGDQHVGARNRAWATLSYTSGAMAANAADCAAFLEALMAGAVIPDSLLREAVAFGPAEDENIRELHGYGLGLERLVIDDEEWIGHLGDFIGSGAAVLYSPRERVTIAVTGNMSTFDGVAAIRALRRALSSMNSTGGSLIKTSVPP